MTLQVMVSAPDMALHASDRWLTFPPSGSAPGALADAFANKTVILLAKHGVASLGYSGLAYIDSTPTDHWIAECLWQEDLPPVFGMQLANERNVQPLDLGSHANRLADALSTRFASMRARDRGVLVVFIVGFTWPSDGGVFRQIDWSITNNDGASRTSFVVHRHPSHKATEQQATIRANRPFDVPEIFEALRQAASVDARFEILAKLNREVAAIDPAVGPDALLVAIVPSERTITTKFVPGVNAVLAQRGIVTGTPPLAFTPWVVGSTSIVAPTVMGSAGLGVKLDGFDVTFKPMDGSPHMFGAPMVRATSGGPGGSLTATIDRFNKLRDPRNWVDNTYVGPDL